MDKTIYNVKQFRARKWHLNLTFFFVALAIYFRKKNGIISINVLKAIIYGIIIIFMRFAKILYFLQREAKNVKRE